MHQSIPICLISESFADATSLYKSSGRSLLKVESNKLSYLLVVNDLSPVEIGPVITYIKYFWEIKKAFVVKKNYEAI